MNFKNFPMVPRVVFGRGSFDQLEEIITSKRTSTSSPFIFLVDDVFKGSPLEKRIPLYHNDKVIFINSDVEPKTSQVDALRDSIKEEFDALPSGVIGIGGGTLMDLAKAVAIMLNNPGSSEDYQGWDLLKNPALYHVGIPTISGTGAEVSRTTVLTGPEKKLGINSDHTPFDQVVLDPDLCTGVPLNQWFYTGMDCYIHCIESLTGTYLNAFSQSYGEKSLDLCNEVFFNGSLSEDESRDKLMMASWHGGMSIAYSQVGVAHAMSYGLSYLLGTRHGVGNCIVFDHLEEFYPEGVKQFKKMVDKYEVEIPKGLCANLTDDDFDTMISVSMGMVPLWENALGKDWKQVITPQKLRGMYEKM
ncbi:iron-containing alcohol dehydrogenase family protein [Sinomicrobium weinanense]|uniref:Iron-containing alcohol dehydrogenase n=1 Tax=Sinomicrobium weinanense TaxID=2842200 RepID=A0A926JSS3_9FLAO|nr:iron-containing alcohol dehydrogenase family protein [Sinomicrobium weinanense]MBC9796711.1 iron-containing alcohol dehydrogenase [Sinomicrobium weinanense]MBU3123014.1 iron-containing alcohol dehydrogenase [Sinomicrobium weinanense]